MRHEPAIGSRAMPNGAKCADLCRKYGMSEGTFYAWKAKYSGMTVSEAKRLKALEDENAKLKKRKRRPRPIGLMCS